MYPVRPSTTTGDSKLDGGTMAYSRRSFMKWAATMSTFAVTSPHSTNFVPLLSKTSDQGFRPDLLPPQKEVWDNLAWMAGLGPKLTGNKAHNTYIDFLQTQMEKMGLEVTRDHYSLPMWEAKRWEITIQSPNGDSFKPKVTSYYPYSGQTSAEGVTGELFYVGSNPTFFEMKELKGKIALIDFVCASREWQMMYTQWGICPPSAHFPEAYKPARGAVTNLAPFVEAGALAVILVWTDISDDNAMDQYTPFSRPPQNMPSLYVGRETGIKLSQMASAGAKATVVLEATTTPDTPTDTLMCTLKGNSSDEAVICNSHTDGPNAIEENGPVGIIALAKYFSSIPKSDRRRDMVFPLHTGHFALPWVPDVKGVVDKHPDLVKRTVAAVTVEHLACKEWIDDASLMHYRPTGQNCWDVTITKHKPMADLALDALKGKSEVHNTAVVNPLHDNGWFGVGTPFGMAGIPTIQYIPQPNYLLQGPPNGCLEKLDSDLLYSQVQFFAKILNATNGMTAAQLKGA
jgi:hypothetical protein